MKLGLRQEEVGGRDTTVGALFEEPGGGGGREGGGRVRWEGKVGG